MSFEFIAGLSRSKGEREKDKERERRSAGFRVIGSQLLLALPPVSLISR